jgi:putative lipoprotein (rSAM/lipoprotein system)
MKTSKIITGLLALLGFTGCDVIGGKDMYGTPTASYEVKGRVTDSEGEPVRDIKIVVGDENTPEEYMPVGITDASGSYSVTWRDFPDSPFPVTAQDIDGPENGGEFATEVVEVKFVSDDYVGGDGWYSGKATKEIDFELELKPQQENENE